MKNLEIYGSLARLLSNENLIVQYKKRTTTASFDLEKRILTIPIFDCLSDDANQLFVCHEIGHALYTPFHKCDVPPVYVNIVEDVRVEKFIKRKYPGTKRTFYDGYKSLHDIDFFDLNGKNINELSFPDRVNLHFKIGCLDNVENIVFSEDEQLIVDEIARAETFDDVIEAARKLCNHSNNSEENIITMIEINTILNKFSPNTSNTSNDSDEIDYISLPDLDVSDSILSWSKIANMISDKIEFLDSSDFLQFKKNAKKEVDYLVNEFARRKAADSYCRTRESKTGVLDMAKLSTYYYNDDLFKKSTVVPEGKNHGLIFILDWSGSMSSCIFNTCKQLFKLIFFCRRASIPFEVYAFGSEMSIRNKKSYNNTPNKLIFNTDKATLLNFISSKCSPRDLDKQIETLYRISNSGDHYGFSMGSTPLNECLMSLPYIINTFKKIHRVQKLNCVILTDGESNPGEYHNDMNKRGKLGRNVFLQDQTLKTTYRFSNNDYYNSEVIIKNLRDIYPNVGFIGMRLIDRLYVREHLKRYIDDFNLLETVNNQFKSTGSCSILTPSYHQYFMFTMPDAESSSEFESIENAMKNFKINTKILSQFISIIA